MDQGAVHRAIGHLEYVLAVYRLRLGADHPYTLGCRDNDFLEAARKQGPPP